MNEWGLDGSGGNLCVCLALEKCSGQGSAQYHFFGCSACAVRADIVCSILLCIESVALNRLTSLLPCLLALIVSLAFVLLLQLLCCDYPTLCVCHGLLRLWGQ